MNHNYTTVIASTLIFFTSLGHITSQSSEPEFLQCTPDPIRLCIEDIDVRLPDNNQIFLGENHPEATSCSVHLTRTMRVRSACSTPLAYEVQLFLWDTSVAYILKSQTTIETDTSGEAELFFHTEESPEAIIKQMGMSYTTGCELFHRIRWIVTDTCGHVAVCDQLLDLFDCKAPEVVRHPGTLFIVQVPLNSIVEISANDFILEAMDDCGPSDHILFSFDEDRYQPDSSFHFCDADDLAAPVKVNIWVADEGRDWNCDGWVEWNERQRSRHEILVRYDVLEGPNCHFDYILIGKITTSNLQPVGNVRVDLITPPIIYSTVTGFDGYYSFTFPVQAGSKLTAFRNDNHKNGVSTIDLVRIQKHLLGIDTFTRFDQYIAADANRSSTISAIDLIELRKLILGHYTELPKNLSWRFISKEVPLDLPADQWSVIDTITTGNPEDPANYDFWGIKIGDVNLSADPNLHHPIPRGAEPLIPWVVYDQQFKSHEMIEIPFTLASTAEIQGFQFTLSSPDLVFLDIIPGVAAISHEHFALFDDKMTLSWFDDQGITMTEGQIAFTLIARAKTHGNLKSTLQLNSDITLAELFTPKEEIFIPVLHILDAKPTKPFILSAEPNPWKDQTDIIFSLPESAPITFEVFNLDGRLLYIHKGHYPEGHNNIRLSAKDFSEHGLLLYTLKTVSSHSTQKMVLLE